MAFILSASGNPEVWLSESMMSQLKINQQSKQRSGPCWSPDGRRLIVTSDSRVVHSFMNSRFPSRLTRIPTNISSHCTEATGTQGSYPDRIYMPLVVDFKFANIALLKERPKFFPKVPRWDTTKLGKRWSSLVLHGKKFERSYSNCFVGYRV